jgi:hypothetical protein
MAEWDRLFVRVDQKSGGSHYRAWANGIEFSGVTSAYPKQVEEILRRMIKAPWEPPEVVVRTAKLIYEHIEHYLRHIDVFGDDLVGTAVDYKDPEAIWATFTLYIEVETQQVYIIERIVNNGREDLGPAESGWVTTFIARYEGYDGYDGDGEHEVRHRVGFKGRIDPNVVWMGLYRVVRHAVNAMPTCKQSCDAPSGIF